MFFVLLLIVGVAELVLTLILLKITDDSGKTAIGIHATNIGLGIVFREISRIRMEVIDGYSWEGDLCDYEVETYAFLYVGLLLIVMGIVGTASLLYSAMQKPKEIKEDDKE